MLAVVYVQAAQIWRFSRWHKKIGGKSKLITSLDSTDFLDVCTYVQHGTVQTQYICIRATQLYLAGRASLISSRTLSLLILPPNQSFQIQE